jgi:hypothetical protein
MDQSPEASPPSSRRRAGNSGVWFIHHDVIPLEVRREKNAGLHALHTWHLPKVIEQRL